MRGTSISDEQRAAFVVLCAAGESIAEIGRRLGLSRPRVSKAVNHEADLNTQAHAALTRSGRLASALASLGLAEYAPQPEVEAIAFEEAVEITPSLIEAAAQFIVSSRCPPEAALVDLGADRRAVRRWLEDAERVYDEGCTAWPASGWRVLDRARNRVGLDLLSAAVADPGSAASRLRLGRLIAPELFAEPDAVSVGRDDPFEDLSDQELYALATGAER